LAAERARPSEPESLGEAVARGRRELVVLRLGGADRATDQGLRLSERADSFQRHLANGVTLTRVGVARATRGVAIGLLLPLAVLSLQVATGQSADRPGWVTWQWTIGLGLINSVFLVAGPPLWNAYLTAALEIDCATDRVARQRLVKWITSKYHRARSPGVQMIFMVVGGCLGMCVLYGIHRLSDGGFHVGYAEYFAMFETAAIATNGFWILWWVPDLVPRLQEAHLRLLWHDPARSPVIISLNRALWKTGFAIAVGIVTLAIAVSGLPATVLRNADVGYEWSVVVIVQYVAFGIVAGIFLRVGAWGQWCIFRLVRAHIDQARREVDRSLIAHRATFSRFGPRSARVAYLSQLDRHLDSLHSVDLKLGWAVTWGSSIVGTAASVIVALYQATPR
jgi:hypothetical protein